MMKKFGIQFLFFISALVLLSSCKKTNWRENYREREKSPFGTYIIYNEAENLFPNVRRFWDLRLHKRQCQ